MASLLKKNEGIELSKRRREFNALSNAYVSSGNKKVIIPMDIPTEHIDFENSYLSFTISATSAVSGDLGFNRYVASSWIKEMRWKSKKNKQIGDNLSNYNVMARTLMELQSSTDQEASFLDATEGASGVAIATVASIADEQYTHRVITSIGAMSNYFPARYLDGLNLEIDLANGEEVVLQASGETGGVYTITDLTFVCRLVELKPQVEQQLLAAVVSPQGLVIDYTESTNIISTLTATSKTTFRLGNINGRIKSLKTVQIIDKANQSVDENNTFSKNNTASYQYFLAGKPLTENVVTVASDKNAEYLMEYLISQKLLVQPYGIYGKSALTPAVLAASKFVIGQEVDRSKTDEILSSPEIVKGNDLQLKLTFSPNAAAASAHTMVMVDKRMVIRPNSFFENEDFAGQ